MSEQQRGLTLREAAIEAILIREQDSPFSVVARIIASLPASPVALPPGWTIDLREAEGSPTECDLYADGVLRFSGISRLAGASVWKCRYPGTHPCHADNPHAGGVCGPVDAASAAPVESPDREALGRLVREVWIEWAQEQPDPKPSWLVPWEGLAEPDREVDRRIGERLASVAAAPVEQDGRRTVPAPRRSGKGRTEVVDTPNGPVRVSIPLVRPLTDEVVLNVEYDTSGFITANGEWCSWRDQSDDEVVTAAALGEEGALQEAARRDALAARPDRSAGER